jgi:hypothetical protein
MDKLQEAFDFCLKHPTPIMRPAVLADGINVRKDAARGLVRVLVWLGVLERKETPSNGVYYWINKQV